MSAAAGLKSGQSNRERNWWTSNIERPTSNVEWMHSVCFKKDFAKRSHPSKFEIRYSAVGYSAVRCLTQLPADTWNLKPFPKPRIPRGLFFFRIHSLVQRSPFRVCFFGLSRNSSDKICDPPLEHPISPYYLWRLCLDIFWQYVFR